MEVHQPSPIFFGERGEYSEKKTAVVRFETAEQAQAAVETLNTSANLENVQCFLEANAKGLTTVRLTCLPAHFQWQEVKDVCGQFGKVMFCDCAVESARCMGEIRMQSPEHAHQAIAPPCRGDQWGVYRPINSAKNPNYHRP